MKNVHDDNFEILQILRNLIPNPKSELEFNNEFELLVAVILSAQCTDKRVNIITRDLFKKYPTVYDFAKLSEEELAYEIRSCNYFNNKARNIIKASKDIVEKFNGQVPSCYENLVSLAGVGNKTANVLLAVGFKKQAFPVDTHVLRVSNRLGFVKTNNPNKCEEVLVHRFVGFDFAELHHLLLLFGRYYCTARNPKCCGCVLRNKCKYIEGD